jgi:hypothetical protein
VGENKILIFKQQEYGLRTTLELILVSFVILVQGMLSILNISGLGERKGTQG